MLVVIVFCASILSSRPGCTAERVPVVVDVIPAGCFAKAQALAAERAPLHVGEVVARYGCQRRAEASS